MIEERARILTGMMGCGFIEIRYLLRYGNTEQALALAEAFHNVPQFVTQPESWEPQYFSDVFCQYVKKYGKGRYDYLAYLEKVAKAD